VLSWIELDQFYYVVTTDRRTMGGDIIWTKKYPHFYSQETILTTSGDLLFYGSNYSSTNVSSPKTLSPSKLAA